VSLKLKLHRYTPTREPEPTGSLRFPVRAVREMRGVHTPPRDTTKERSMAKQEPGALRHPELIRQIEATLDRMQAGLDQLSEQVKNYKFPGFEDEERPRAA
jgi:hypothetical protein